MARIYNFGAGPATLPESVLRQAAEELVDYRGCGMSVMEMSHRGEIFTEIAGRAEANLRELLGIPDGYRVLFLQGGATLQFSAVPMNLLGGRGRADYIDTGHWSQRAIAEARRYCTVNEAASGAAGNYTSIPPRSEWRLDPGAAYVHYTPNETIGGVEFHWIPDTGDVPLVADMSSNILSRPLDVSRFGLIYAGAQKNVGPAGLTLVIVREDVLAEPVPGTPLLLDYRLQAEHSGMYNTPPTFAIYLAGLVFEWLKQQGGLAAMEARNLRKSKLLYDCLDASSFFRCPVDPACRSRMNVPFTLRDTALEKPFLEEAERRGLTQLRGHRAVGGMRASIYNAMPEEGVAALVEFLRAFEARHG